MKSMIRPSRWRSSAEAARSYLDQEAVVEAALSTGAEAIHPGYGFLSENAAFAEKVAAAGLVFVGPSPSAIRAMGLKGEAKQIMEKAGVPVVPGYHGERQETDFLRQKAYEIGYPVLIKAVAGGGGKGMRRVDKALDFEAALAAAKREAEAAFGDGRVLVEKFVKSPRHVEIQVFADAHGTVVSLNERDCSLQRRHQKVLEEAPAPGLDAATRAAMNEAAVRAAEAVGYRGAGTVEFIADASEGLSADRFYFMEMNTRLQVEHPVTEMVTGLDLVEWQLRVAAGERLAFSGEGGEAGGAIAPRGHAVEVRLYAEDPERGFLPSAGRLERLVLPDGEGVRVDAGVLEGDAVSAFYDPMIAKIIVHGDTREAAFDRLSAALARTRVIGPKTNLAFLRALADHPAVRAGRHDTGFVDGALAELVGGTVPAEAVAAAVAACLEPAEGEGPGGWPDPWAVRDGFRLSGRARQALRFEVDGAVRAVGVSWLPDARAEIELDGETFRPVADAVAAGLVERTASGVFALGGGRAVRVAPVDELARTVEDLEAGGAATAPMHGRVAAIHVAEGDEVVRGTPLFAVEAMKMEHTVTAVADGRVSALERAVGDQVAQGATVVRIEPAVAEAPGGT